MKGKLGFTAALLVVFVLSATFVAAVPASYLSGVSVGTKARYAFFQTGLTDNACETEVTSVNGAVVGYTITWYYPNGTVDSYNTNPKENVSSQEAYVYYYYVAANLATGDPIYSGSSMRINDTTTNFHIAGIVLTVIHLNVTYMYGTININGYWDKNTGMMVKFQYRQTGFYTANWTLTSLTSGPVFPINMAFLLLIGGGAVVIIVALAVVLRKRK